MHRSTLEQWFVLQTVVDIGGFTAAARQLNRSQSSVSYAIKNLQEQLGASLLVVEGKKVALTPIGVALLEDVRPLLREFTNIESRAKFLTAGAAARIRLTVDCIYPKPLLFSALKIFQQNFPHTQVELEEVIRFTPSFNFSVGDLAIGLPFYGELMGQKLLDVELVGVAHPNHPLHHMKNSALTMTDLHHHTQVYMDNRYEYSPEMIEKPSQRWTVNTIESAIEAVRSQLCFGWLPKHMIQTLLEQNELKLLPLATGLMRKIPLYLTYTDYDHLSPTSQALVQIIQETNLSSADG
ncbi:LysR family transcriptional regulator [Vibrio mangrovi]|uniref:Hca operon transcriptional activator n=1 Tax=Vibrio mangrovi TaxID=474394 RepID=A0A1Y6IWV0_9VIBR|nr:LysR family transcriptional regulator [Vibrio mangrovi]MDW6001465.1 LysR family transcriptional regulator [Vibrio mangrovi]SMS00513.1 Hca operon transcriptional activator [Vibrio mangrovi]